MRKYVLKDKTEGLHWSCTKKKNIMLLIIDAYDIRDSFILLVSLLGFILEDRQWLTIIYVEVTKFSSNSFSMKTKSSCFVYLNEFTSLVGLRSFILNNLTNFVFNS